MGMLIAWQTLNKLANPQDARFSDTFLIVTPGITIRDRLRVLFPNDPNNYYRLHDLVPPELLTELGKAKMVITNFHAFKLREKVAAGKLTKDILRSNGSNDLSRHYSLHPCGPLSLRDFVNHDLTLLENLLEMLLE